MTDKKDVDGNIQTQDSEDVNFDKFMWDDGDIVIERGGE